MTDDRASLTVALISDVFVQRDEAPRLVESLRNARSRGADLAVLPETPLNSWSPATRTPNEHDAEAPGAQLRDGFDREARAISSLTHPHICALYDVGHADGSDFLLLEYIDGESLAARLERGPLPVDEALRVAIEIADALATAHRAGV